MDEYEFKCIVKTKEKAKQLRNLMMRTGKFEDVKIRDRSNGYAIYKKLKRRKSCEYNLEVAIAIKKRILENFKLKYATLQKVESRIRQIQKFLDENRMKIAQLRMDERTQRKITIHAERDELAKELQMLLDRKTELLKQVRIV